MRAQAVVVAIWMAGWCLATPRAEANAPTPAQAKAPARSKATATPDFERLAKEAREALEAGKVEAAVSAYEKALALRPDWIEGRWALANALYQLDRCPEAREHFRRVVAAQREDGVAWAMTGLCDVRMREYDMALADLEQAQRAGIARPEIALVARVQMALLLNRGGNPEAAFELLRDLATDGRDDPQVIVAFGLSMLHLASMPDEVPPEKREMVRLAGRGGYHMARGRRTAVGRLAMEELVSRFPSEPNVHYALGAYLAADDPDAAIEEFRKELRTTPDDYRALVQIASLQVRAGRAADAVSAAEEAVRVAPDVPAARLVLGRALLDTGAAERAVQELEKGASLAPQSAEIQFSLARAYQRVGRGEDAERARQEFTRLDQANRARQARPEREGGPEQEPGGKPPGQGGPNQP